MMPTGTVLIVLILLLAGWAAFEVWARHVARRELRDRLSKYDRKERGE